MTSKNFFLFLAFGLLSGCQTSEGYRQLLESYTDWELKMKGSAPKTVSESQAKDASEIAPISGLKLVERLRKSPMSPNPYIPIIMMMDSASGTEVMMARDVGVNEILLRPVNAEDFCERLISIIDNPKPFITATTYKGPCRRRRKGLPPQGMKERRIKEIRVIKSITR